MVIRAAAQTLAIRFLMLGAGIVASIITARSLGPAGRGVYYLVFMSGTLAVQLATLGLHASNTYLVAQDRRRLGPLLGISLWVSLVAATAAAGLVVLIALPAAGAAQAGRAIYWAIPYAPCALFVLLSSTLFVGAGRVGTYNLIQLLSALLALAGVAVAAALHETVNGFLAALVIAMFVAGAAALGCGLRTPASLRFDRALFASGARYALRAYVVGLLGFMVTRVNVFVLAHRAPPDQVGMYSVAMQFFDVLSILPASLGTVLLPSLIARGNPWRSALRSTLWTAVLLAPACALTALLAGPLIGWLFGARFEPAAWVTVLVMPAAFFIGMVSVLSQYLAAGGYPRELILIWGAALALVVLVSTLLVPRLGANGAAVSLSTTYLLVLLAVLLASLRFAGRQRRPAAAPSQITP
jgi:O-antigen/teichoic acid export membrane protein